LIIAERLHRRRSISVAQQGPQANTPAEHTVAGLAATPQVTAHSELPVQVVLQSPSHFTLQLAESVQLTVLTAPTWILHVALVLHTTMDAAPSLKSQFELALHVT
jgi:hypothetical protein